MILLLGGVFRLGVGTFGLQRASSVQVYDVAAWAGVLEAFQLFGSCLLAAADFKFLIRQEGRAVALELLLGA